MRGSTPFPLALDLLSLLVVVALVTVVYLCSLPETFQSLSHRKANAAELMGHARNLIVEEGTLFASQLQAADEQASTRIRRQLVDNERAFHDVASEFSAELPEAANDIESLVSLFDRLSASGWRTGAEPLDANFVKALEELRSRSERIEFSLQRHDS
jgi:hypothetical protein